MSYRSKRELLAQVAPRYQQASHSQKSVILDEFVAVTGYARKYAIRLLTRPPLPAPAQIRRPRSPTYGAAVQAALEIAWAAANFISARRLVPFLPTLVPVLEQHNHLHLPPDVRTQLLALSPATADRLLRRARKAGEPHGKSTTKAGTLLKRQIPVRTFADWNDAAPGFVEADLVAHCGEHTEGAFLCTLVLTDIATGWVECQALLYRSSDQVIQGLTRAQQLIPFPLHGLDTDNGGEFINNELLAFCEQAQLTFTRGRAYRKNDQCYVEQKNGAVVRQFVGYDRFEGEQAYRQLIELYRALRLYVNFFQPSLKLEEKTQEQGRTRRRYLPAKTPFERLCSADLLAPESRLRLDAIFAALDPVRLLRQIGQLQEALWSHAVANKPNAEPSPSMRFLFDALLEAPAAASSLQRQKRPYHRKQPEVPRWWRTHLDPFAKVWTEVESWLEQQPDLTGVAVFKRLQSQYPDTFPDGQLRTLQRRVARWRATVVMAFDDQWMEQEVLAGVSLPRPLRVVPGEQAASDTTPVPPLLAAGQEEQLAVPRPQA
jgi:hypothetical protein